MAQKKTRATFRIDNGTFQPETDFMSERVNNNPGDTAAAGLSPAFRIGAAGTAATTKAIRHLYVHVPFCARICPYCAFYKDLVDRSQTDRFCEAILREIEQYAGRLEIVPKTIFFGGGTPTALTTSQLAHILNGFRRMLDLSSISEWTLEANPGSVSARKAALLRSLGVNRISLGVQSWDNELLKVLGREHNAAQAENSFLALRDAGFSNINVDLMFGLPTQTAVQWKATLEKTIALSPDHVSAYCLTYEEDTEFFLRQSRGELQPNAELEADFFEMTMSTLQEGGYEQYEISNYARAGYFSIHNRAYWAGQDYLGIGPSAFSTVGMRRWQNICNYREYADRVLSGQSPISEVEELTPQKKRAETIALSLRTDHGVSAITLQPFEKETREFMELGLLRQSNGNFVLTPKGKSLADSVAEAFV
jgi:oxygen-independent coproporphyrinogen III oxidase